MSDKMKKHSTSSFPAGFAVSVPGAGHIRFGTPCQDASGVITAPRPAAIVCDGRGSAPNSHFGAQRAVKAFFSQVGVLEPFLSGVLDNEPSNEKWMNLCRLLYRTLFQVKLDLSGERGGDEKDYDFTVALAIAGRTSIGVFQVGDGAVVLRQDGVCRTAFPPDKGEFANQTHFLRSGGEESCKFHAALFSAEANSGIAITSDGPEYLMFRQSDMTPGSVFDEMLGDLAAGELCEQDVRDYLTRSAWATDPRGADDRSLVVLLPVFDAVVPNSPSCSKPVCNSDDSGLIPSPKDDRRMESSSKIKPEAAHSSSGNGMKMFVAVLPWVIVVLLAAVLLHNCCIRTWKHGADFRQGDFLCPTEQTGPEIVEDDVEYDDSDVASDDVPEVVSEDVAGMVTNTSVVVETHIVPTEKETEEKKSEPTPLPEELPGKSTVQ